MARPLAVAAALLLLAAPAAASPLSTAVCGCPAACAVTTVQPSCGSPVVLAANTTNATTVPASLDWLGFVPSTWSNVTVTSNASASAVNCSGSFFEVHNASALLLHSALVQTSNVSCATAIPSWLASNLTTTFVGLHALGAANPVLGLASLTGHTLYDIQTVARDPTGTTDTMVLVSLVNLSTTAQCCGPPAVLAFTTATPTNPQACVAMAPLASQDPVTFTTTYEMPTLEAACAYSVAVDGSGNTVLSLVVTFIPPNMAATSCPGNTFFVSPHANATQLIPRPATFAASVTAYGFVGDATAACPFSPAGFVKRFVYVAATSQWTTSFTSSLLQVPVFTSVAATPGAVGAPFVTAPAPTTTVFTWRVVDTVCVPTAALACGTYAAFTSTAQSIFDGVVHYAAPGLVIPPSSCAGSSVALSPSCVLNDTRGFFDPQFYTVVARPFAYDYTQTVVIRSPPPPPLPVAPFPVPPFVLSVVVDTVVATWVDDDGNGQNATFSPLLPSQAALFCRSGCSGGGGGGCAAPGPDDQFVFVPSQWGFGGLGVGAGNATTGTWSFALAASVYACPTTTSSPASSPATPAPTLAPVAATTQMTSPADVTPQTPGCLPLAAYASATVAVTATPQTSAPGESTTVALAVVLPLCAFAFVVAALTTRSWNRTGATEPRVARHVRGAGGARGARPRRAPAPAPAPGRAR